jgi:dienelactone hydrolase
MNGNPSVFIAGIAGSHQASQDDDAVPGDLGDFTRGDFTDEHGIMRQYYRIGAGLRPVMVLHEVWGFSPADVSFCRRLAKAGFTVYAPVIFGIPGKAWNPLYAAECLIRVCVSREFALLSWYRSSPVTDSLRVLGRKIYAAHGEPGFGVVGLCLTGNFALAMMADEHLVAPVVSEPALPAAYSTRAGAAIGLSDGEIACVKSRVAAGQTILGYRFDEDRICPTARFDSMSRTFGDGFEGHSIEKTPHGHHSVFTDDYCATIPSTRDAFLRLVEFLGERLAPGAQTTSPS